MNEPPTFRVWELPGLGGWLAMLNGALWVASFSLARAHSVDPPDWVQIVVGTTVLFVSLPVALPFVLPSCPHGGYPDEGETVGMAIMIGLNAFAWGYGIAWLLGGVKKWIRVLRPVRE